MPDISRTNACRAAGGSPQTKMPKLWSMRRSSTGPGYWTFRVPTHAAPPGAHPRPRCRSSGACVGRRPARDTGHFAYQRMPGRRGLTPDQDGEALERALVDDRLDIPGVALGRRAEGEGVDAPRHALIGVSPDIPDISPPNACWAAGVGVRCARWWSSGSLLRDVEHGIGGRRPSRLWMGLGPARLRARPTQLSMAESQHRQR